MDLFHIIPQWLFYSLGAVLAIISYEYIFKKVMRDETAEKERHPVAYAAAIFFTVAVYCSLIYPFAGYQPSDFQNLFNPQISLILAANIILYTAAPFFYYRAFKRLPLSEIVILYSMTGIYALIIGVILGTESFLLTRLIGGIIILSSVALVSIKEKKWNFSKDFISMVIATFFYSLASITDDQLMSNNHFSIFFLEAIAFGIPAILLILVDKDARRNFGHMFKMDIYPSIAFNAILYLVSFFAILSAYKVGGDASQVNLVLATETIIVVIIAAIFLKERDSIAKKILAAVLVCLGVYLLS